MRRDKPPPWTLRLFTRGKLLHCQRLRPIDGLKKPETLGIPTASRGKPVCKGPTVKPTEVIKNLFTISKIKPAWPQPAGISYKRLKTNGAAFPPQNWWRRTESNRRPSACKADALPTELRPRRVVGLGRLELPTSRLSSARSNQLSYRPEG